MKVFLCLLLLSIVISAVDNLKNIERSLKKRGLDHRSNIALLNNLNYESPTPVNNLDQISAPAPTIVTANAPDGTIPVTINTENLALGNPNPITNNLQLTYAPSYPSSIPQNIPAINPQSLTDNNLIYFTGENTQTASLPFINVLTPLLTNSNLQSGVVNDIQDNRNVLQTYVPQNLVQVPQNVIQVPQNVIQVPQPYPVQVIREVKVPQPYPVHITRTIQVPVQVRVPVEVPKPYPVRVPHPVPVPVHIKVPVPIEKPYPVQITKTVAIPVEKPVYIKVPQPIQVPIAQPYPVGVPQPVQVQVPFVVRLPELPGETPPAIASLISNLEGSPTPVLPSLEGAPALPDLNPIARPVPIGAVPPTTECSSCKDKVNESTTSSTSPKPSLPSITGNGLLPPHPPSNSSPKTAAEEGLLSSYVSSKDGGVYRRGTEYQTQEYKKTW